MINKIMVEEYFSVVRGDSALKNIPRSNNKKELLICNVLTVITYVSPNKIHISLHFMIYPIVYIMIPLLI